MMKRWGLHRIRDSFSARLRVYVVGFTALLFVVAFYVFFRFSYGFIRDEAVHRAEALLDNTILRIDGVLDAVETAAGNSAWEVETHPARDYFQCHTRYEGHFSHEHRTADGCREAGHGGAVE